MKDGHAGQNTLKMFQWLTDANSLARFQLEFANAFLVLAAPLGRALGYGPTHTPEVTTPAIPAV